jgi:branched-chain amino acid transport system substrate-binding protein
MESEGEKMTPPEAPEQKVDEKQDGGMPPIEQQRVSETPPRNWLQRYGIWLLVVVLLVAAVASYFITRSLNQGNAEDKPLKIGLLAAFTGGSSTHGHGISKGVQLAQKELGATNVEVIQEDSQCDPKVGQEAMQRLIDQNVDVVIGDGCSSVSVAVLPLANGSETPMVSPGASSPALSLPNDFFFRVIPSDRWQGSFMAQTMYDAGHRRVAVFYTNEPYGSGMNNEFRTHFESLGGEVVATATAEPDVTELNEHIDQLLTANPDALFVAPNSILTGTAAIQTAYDKGLRVPYYAADIFYDTTVITNAPEASQGLVVSTFNTGTQAFKDALAAESPVQEQLFAAPEAYDAFHVIYEAYQRGARTGREFKETFPLIEFQGVSAYIRFNEDGELDGSDYVYSLLRVEDDAFIEIPPGEVISAD